MMVRPRPRVTPARSVAQRLVQQQSDFTAEGAPAPAPTAPPVATVPPAGPARRKRWPPEPRR